MNGVSFTLTGSGLLYRSDFASDQRPRDFSARVDARDWKLETLRGAGYTLFDPLRSYIWRKYKRELQSDRVGPFLSALLEATSRHVEQRLAREDRRENVNPERLNREIIQHLRQTLSDRGISPR